MGCIISRPRANKKAQHRKSQILTEDPYTVSKTRGGYVPFNYTPSLAVDSKIPRFVTHIYVYPSVEEIKERACMNCFKLEAVDLCYGLKIINKKAFFFCTSLKRISIPSSCTQIGKQAFGYCRRLEQVELQEGLEKINNGGFIHCDRLKRIRIPSTCISLGANSFKQCYQLEEVEICHGVEAIHSGCFMQCRSLKRISIPSRYVLVQIPCIIRTVFTYAHRLVIFQCEKHWEARISRLPSTRAR